MKDLISMASFEGRNIRLVDHLGDRWIPAQEIGEVLGYEFPVRSISNLYQRNEEMISEYSVVTKLVSTDGKLYDTRVFNEEGVIAICLKSNQPKAIAFQRWAVRTLKGLLKGQLAHNQAELVDLQRRHIALLGQVEGLKVQAQRPRNWLYTPAMQQQIRDGLANGLGADRISRLIGVSREGVRAFQNRHGLKRMVPAQAELSFGGAL